MHFLSKFLPFFVLPLGFSLILLVFGLVGLVRQRRRFLWAALVVLLVSSNSFVAHLLIRTTEGWAERRLGAEVPAADAVVVLSAGQYVAPGRSQVSEWNDANRFFGGVEVFAAGKAPWLVFTGAAVSSRPDLPTEGEVLAAKAQALGVPAASIAVTPTVLNTADEAREVAAVLRARHIEHPRVILVTSAFHMRRARLVFEQSGMAVEPFPVSFWSGDITEIRLLSLLPSVSAMGTTQTALRELYGRAFYWLRGVLGVR